MTEQNTWSSKFIFLLAAVGAAVGLANIWKFPYTLGQHGGGGFILIYCLAMVFISFPVLVTEFLLGRSGKSDPVNSIAGIANKAGRSSIWSMAAYLGIFSAILIMSFYFVITGWILYYAIQLSSGNLIGMSSADLDEFFKTLTLNETVSISYHTLTAFLVWMIAAAGLKNGIEKCVSFLMPLLFSLLIMLTIYSCFYGDLQSALDFLFQIKYDDITSETILSASGQAFFTVGAGSCVMIVYGSYLPENVSIIKSSIQIILMDAMVALLAGIAIFPLVFSYNLHPSEGPGLLFVTLPIIFSQSVSNSMLGAAFFLMVVIAAITSAIAIVQPPIIWLEKKFHLNRSAASAIAIGIIWLLGLGTVCSFNMCSGFYPLNFLPFFSGKTVFDVIETISINICLPIGAFLLSVFVGWRVPLLTITGELQNEDKIMFRFWYFSLRYIIPPAIFLIMVSSLYHY